MRTLFNIVQSQVGWFACVLSAAAGRAWIGVVIACALIALHVARAPTPARELALLLIAGVIGAVGDTILVQLGVLRFSAAHPPGVTTLWMITLWIVFATTLRYALAWMHTRLLLAALVGAIAGPAAYLAGERLGAIVIADSPLALLAIAVEWALALPALLIAARAPFPYRGPDLRRSGQWI